MNDEEVEKERIQSPEERARFDDTTKCILCAACTTSCPIFWADETYIGPAAIVNAHRSSIRATEVPASGSASVREDGRVPLSHDLQLHRGVPSRHRGHEGDPGSEARDPVRPWVRVARRRAGYEEVTASILAGDHPVTSPDRCVRARKRNVPSAGGRSGSSPARSRSGS